MFPIDYLFFDSRLRCKTSVMISTHEARQECRKPWAVWNSRSRNEWSAITNNLSTMIAVGLDICHLISSNGKQQDGVDPTETLVMLK